jgi:predicted dehydrogenase
MSAAPELKTNTEKMKVLVIGAGRMGVRHCQGIAATGGVMEICLVDINKASLETARKQLETAPDPGRFRFLTLAEFEQDAARYDVAILATTASGRIATCESVVAKGVKHVLVEKPLGQNYEQVKELCDFFASHLQVKAYVNLNTRLYDSYIQLKNDLETLPQFQGEKTISLNTGTLGIGANGIHYLDLLIFLLDAKRVEFVAGEIESDLITSGRGPDFCDFGGWCVLAYFDAAGKRLGKALLSMSSQSSVMGPWEIIGPFGRIHIDELEQKRFDKIRKADSVMPLQRYAADYLPMQEQAFVSPFLGDLTSKWLKELQKGNSLLPELSESLPVHKLMFDWLSKSATHKKVFPIT